MQTCVKNEYAKRHKESSHAEILFRAHGTVIRERWRNGPDILFVQNCQHATLPRPDN